MSQPPPLEAPALQPAIVAKCRNVPLAKRRKLGAQPRLLSVGYTTEFAQVLPPKPRAAIRNGARTAPLRRRRPRAACSVLRKIGLDAGEFRPGLLRLSATRAFAVRGCLYEIVYDMRRIVPCSCFAAEVCDFFPPFRGVFAAHHVLPATRQLHSLYAQARRHYVHDVHAPNVHHGHCSDQREAGKVLPAKPSASF